MSLSYLIEIESICLIDVFTGDRQRLVAKALQAEIDFATMYGLPTPDTADDPSCENTTGPWLLLIFFADFCLSCLQYKSVGLPTGFGVIIDCFIYFRDCNELVFLVQTVKINIL